MEREEKIGYLMEAIPSEEAVAELRRRLLFGNTEEELLKEASRTLKSAAPDARLIDWAYALLRLHEEKKGAPEREHLSVREKTERILALFSNPEDLQQIIRREEWSEDEKRAIRLVAHFVSHDIPLASNFKIVDKVYRLLENAYLPPSIASRYFPKTSKDAERNRILEKYEAYRREKESVALRETPPPPSRGLLKRYAYLLGAVATVAAIFSAGLFTGWLLYGQRAEAQLTPTAMESILRKKPPRAPAVETNATEPSTTLLTRQSNANRQILQETLADYGLAQKAAFVTRALLASGGKEVVDALPSGTKRPSGASNLLQTLPPQAPLRIAAKGLETLRGLRLPLANGEGNLSLFIPEGFRLRARETPTTRLLYLDDGNLTYPAELYLFHVDPTIVRYRLVEYGSRRYMPVVSDIWRFSRTGEMRSHEHLLYEKGRISPVRIVTARFLPGGATVETVSTPRPDKNGRTREFLLSRNDSYADARALYREEYELKRERGEWRSEPLRRIWYDEGKKILAKGLGKKE